jgi:hypothetical protein
MSRSIALLVAAAAAFPLVASAAGAPAPAPALLGCGGSRLLRPAGTVVLSCADGNTEIRATRWHAWTRMRAIGTTDFGVNLCTPTCVASRMRFFPGATIRLLAPTPTRTGPVFSRAVVTYTLGGERRTFTAHPAT